MDFASVLLDLASIADFMKSLGEFPERGVERWLLRNPATPGKLSAWQLLHHAEFAGSVIGTLTDAKSHVSQLMEMREDRSTPQDFEVDLGTLGASIDAATVAFRTVLARKLDDPGSTRTALAGLGQAFGYVGLEIAKLQRNKLLRMIDERRRILEAELKPHATAFDEWSEYSTLRDKIEGTLAGVAKAQEAMYAATRNCHAWDFQPDRRRTSSGQRPGELLRHYMGRITPHRWVLRDLADTPAARSTSLFRPPALTLRDPANAGAGSVPSVRPKGNVTASFAVPKCMAKTGWVGLVPAAAPHVDGGVNAREALSSRLLNGQESGSLSFTAPEAAGRYEIRLFESARRGREAALIGFLVGPVAPGKQTVSGVWDLHYGPSRVWDRKSENPLRFVEDGDKVRWGWVRPDDTGSWLPHTSPRIGKRQGNVILTTWGAACGYGEGALTIGDERDDIPLRLIISDDGDSMTWEKRKVDCKDEGRMTVTEEWRGTSAFDDPWTLYRRPQ
jgi:hypothetical protein